MSIPLGKPVGLAVLAYVLWGLFPIYWKQLIHVDAVEVLAHRVLWSVPFAGAVVLIQGRLAALRQIFSNRQHLLILSVTSCLISVNWGVYIWAMGQDKVVEASMGYFLSPLMSVAIGLVVFGEKIDRYQKAALLIAACGVAGMFVAKQIVPWVALILGASFAAYGALRKQVTIDSVTGLFIETLLILPVALGWVLYSMSQGTSGFQSVSISTDILLIGGGIVTATPLLLFIAGAKGMRLSSLGLLFYITPTLQFVIGLTLYQEALKRADLVAFVCIWLALATFAWRQWAVDHND